MSRSDPRGPNDGVHFKPPLDINKDTDCKGDRICQACACVEPEKKGPKTPKK